MQYSGTCGTCSWELDDEGLLRIYPTDGVSGTLASNTQNRNTFWPWHNYKDSVKKVQIDEGVSGNGSCAYMFYNMSNCTEMDLSGFDTSNVTNMQGMFRWCYGLINLDLSNFDTSNVRNMQSMFDRCRLTSLDLSNFDTSNVTNMGGMFWGCSGLTNLDLSSFDTSNVTDMGGMFSGCKNLANLDLSSFNTSMVTNMGGMFGYNNIVSAGCESLSILNLSNFDTSNVTSMHSMFYGCSSLTSLDVSSFDTSNVTDMSSMFFNCSRLTSLDVSNFDTSSVKNMQNMFCNCSGLTCLDVSNFDTSNVTTMESMFSSCSSLTNLDVSNFDTSKALSMNSMFYSCSGLTSLDVSNFDTSNVTNMRSMFSGCSGLTSLDVSNFDTSNVTTMVGMFYNCSGLTSLDLSNFDTSKITTTKEMFYGCSGLTSLDVSNFDTSNVTDMGWMFSSCSGLTSLDVSNFDTSNVTDMGGMFYYCSGLTSLDLSNFDTSNVTNMYGMFSGCNGLSKVKFGDTFAFVGGTAHRFPSKTNWVKTRNADNSKTYDSTEYTSAQLTSFTADSTPTLGGTWQILSTHPYTTNPDGSVEYISIDSDWDYISNNVWEYTFNVFDITKLYYLFEEAIEGYFSNAMEPYAITVRDKQATVTNSTSVEPDVVERGKLVISKTVEGNVPDAHLDDEFEFIITLSGDYIKTNRTQTFSGVIFQGGVGKIYLKNGETKMFDLPEGTSYSVVETDKANYDEAITNNEGMITPNTTQAVTATNTYVEVPEPVGNAVNITLKKTTINNTDPSVKFTISAYFTELTPYAEYELSDGNKFTASDKGTAFYDVQISENEEIVFMNIPENATYQFTEVAGNYTSSYSIVDSNNQNSIVTESKSNTSENTALSTATEVADADEAVVVTFTNEFKTSQSLTIEKLLKQEQDDGSLIDLEDDELKFEITVNFINMTEGETFSSDVGKVVADDEGEASKTFYLTNRESVKFYDIPMGVQYQVVESKNDFTASYTVAGTDVVKSSDRNDTSKKELSTEIETVDINENSKVTFINIKSKDLPVTILKTDSKGNLLEGAKLQIKDASNNVIEEWTSTKEAHIINLKEGTYTLHEVSAPSGYNVAEDMTITISADSDNTFTMIDEKSSWLVSTGGDGVIKVIIVAIVLGAIAGACIYLGKKKSNDAPKTASANNKETNDKADK